MEAHNPQYFVVMWYSISSGNNNSEISQKFTKVLPNMMEGKINYR